MNDKFFTIMPFFHRRNKRKLSPRQSNQNSRPNMQGPRQPPPKVQPPGPQNLKEADEVENQKPRPTFVRRPPFPTASRFRLKPTRRSLIRPTSATARRTSFSRRWRKTWRRCSRKRRGTVLICFRKCPTPGSCWWCRMAFPLIFQVSIS